MKILVDITEDTYKSVCNESMLPSNAANVIDGIKNGQPLSTDVTNGDMIKAMFPDVLVQEIMGWFDKDKLLGYRTWLGGRSQDYLLDWWNAPYMTGSERL